MKITKRQLKRIIKEEKAKILKEQRGPEADSLELALDDYIGARVLAGVDDQQDIQREIQSIMSRLWGDIEMQYGRIDKSRWG